MAELRLGLGSLTPKPTLTGSAITVRRSDVGITYGHFWDIVTGASSCATHLPLKSFLKLKIKTKWFKLELPANEIDMIFTWVGSCQKDEGMFW